MRYNPALDGLRAVAIVLVILFHSDQAIFPGGWIGVDIFFVLSGYLITSILASELKETGTVSLTNFYVRRALRLTPALLLLALFQFARSGFSPNGSEIRTATLISMAYLENWNMVFDFRPSPTMGHTWSLATEEQFYLLWPFALLLVIKRRPLVWIALAIVAMMADRFAFRGHLRHLIFALDARPIGLLVGCALALLPVRLWSRVPAALPFVAMAALLAIAIGLAGADRFLLAGPPVGSLATAAIIVSAQPGSTITALLSLRPAVYIGKISYGLYLYSSPIFILGEQWAVDAPYHLYEIGLIALIFATAALSYEFVEKPILRLKGRFRGGARAMPLAAAGVSQEAA